MKLGKLAPRHDPRTLKLSTYITQLPLPPRAIDWGKGVPVWGMLKNDAIGDCTCAAAGHMVEAWTFDAAQKEARVTDAQIVSAYTAVSGYDPVTGANDEGAVELDVLKYWRKTGIAGHKIQAFATVNTLNPSQVKTGMWLFGGLYIGVELPVSAQKQVIWDVPSSGFRGDGEKGSWGGHAVNLVSYDERGATCVTWGKPLRMTWRFFGAYCSEAYAVLSSDWFSKGKAPSGFDVATLQRDLDQLTKK
jgi:hypothetical protein